MSDSYDPLTLSEDEKKRFVAALGDGFGYSHRSQRLDEERLPPEVNPGLLDHRAYYDKNHGRVSMTKTTKGEFWEVTDDDSPPGLSEQCPLNFYQPAIRQYFRIQKAAYLQYAKSRHDHGLIENLGEDEREDCNNEVYSDVLRQPYSKAWYEYHINRYLYYCAETTKNLTRCAEDGANPSLNIICLYDFAATLGRLIEQYYWKFLIEKSAMRGAKISESAKAGGSKLASIRKTEHARWQAVAKLIWRKRPSMSKVAVAVILKKRLNISQSAKHISRYLQLLEKTGADALQLHDPHS